MCPRSHRWLCWNRDLSLGLLIPNPRFLTTVYPALGSALGTIFSFIPSPLITALGGVCYLDMTHRGPVSREKSPGPSSRAGR